MVPARGPAAYVKLFSERARMISAAFSGPAFSTTTGSVGLGSTGGGLVTGGRLSSTATLSLWLDEQPARAHRLRAKPATALSEVMRNCISNTFRHDENARADRRIGKDLF